MSVKLNESTDVIDVSATAYPGPAAFHLLERVGNWRLLPATRIDQQPVVAEQLEGFWAEPGVWPA